MAVLSPVTILIAVVVFFAYRYLRRKKPSKPYPPGPQGWELVRAFVASMDGTLTMKVREWVKKYGDIVYLPHPQGSMVFIAKPSLVKELYTGKATEKFTNDRMWSYVADKLCLRKNLAFSNPSDPNWPRMRKLMHSNLKFYGEGIAEFEWMVTEALEVMVKDLDSRTGQDIVVREVVEGTISNVIAILLTGEMVEKESPVWKAIINFNLSVLQIADPAFSFAIKVCPFVDYIPGTYYYKYRRENEKAKEMLYNEILLNRKKVRTPGLPRGVVDNLLEYQAQEGKDWFTDHHIMGNIMDIVAGGTNTSVNSTCAIILYLISFPETQRKLQQEVDKVIGHARKPQLKDRPNCPYVEAFLLESFRYASLVPLGFDHFIREDVELAGYTLPKGTVAFSAAYVFHKSDVMWDHPDHFRPERFLDEQGEVVPPTHPIRQNMLPFSTGKRACPGEGFARARIFLLVTTVLQRYDLRPPTSHSLIDTDGPHAWNFGLISVLKPFHCRFLPRQL